MFKDKTGNEILMKHIWRHFRVKKCCVRCTMYRQMWPITLICLFVISFRFCSDRRGALAGELVPLTTVRGSPACDGKWLVIIISLSILNLYGTKYFWLNEKLFMTNIKLLTVYKFLEPKWLTRLSTLTTLILCKLKCSGRGHAPCVPPWLRPCLTLRSLQHPPPCTTIWRNGGKCLHQVRFTFQR